MNNFVKKLIGFSIGPILGALISFITVPVTTFFISPSEFGKASMFTIIQALSVTLIYLGIDQSYTREYHEFYNKKNLFQNALFIPLIASIIFGIIICIFNESFSKLLFDNPEYGYVSYGFALLIFSSVIERFILLSIRMEEKALEYSLFSVTIKAIILVLTVVLVSFGKRDFMTVILSTVIGQVLGDFILFIRYRRLFYFKGFSLDKILLKRMVIFGIPLILAVSVNNFLNASGRLFLRGYSSYHDLGIYNAALKIANLLQIIQTAFTGFWVPTAYRWNRENKEMKYFSIVSDSLLLLITFIFFFLLILKKYFILILSSSYLDAQYVIGLLSLAPILYTLSETSTLGIVFSRKSHLNIWVSVLALIPNIFLNFVLVPKYGTIGAGISIAISYILFCLARTFFSKKTGFSINFKKQIICIILFFISALINVINNKFVLPATILLFILAILFQVSTIKTLLDIKKNPNNWDFS